MTGVQTCALPISPLTFTASEIVLGLGSDLTDTIATTTGLLDFDGPEQITLTSPLGIFTAAEDITFKTFEDADFGTTGATVLTTTANGNVNFVSDTGSVAVTSTTLTMNPPTMQISTHDDFTMVADSIDMDATGSNEFLVASRTADVTITGANTATITATEEIAFTSNGNTEDAGIFLEAPLIDYVVPDQLRFVAEAGNIELDTGAVIFTVDDMSLGAGGIGGITVEAGPLFDANFVDIAFQTNAGRVYFESGGNFDVTAADNIEMITNHFDGHINFLSSGDATFSALSGLFIGAEEDASTRFGEGLILFESDSDITLDTQTLDIRSEHDLRVAASNTVTMTSGTAMNVASSMSATVHGHTSNSLAATTVLTLETNIVDSEVIFSTGELTLSNLGGTETWVAGDDISLLASTTATISSTGTSVYTSASSILMQAGTDLALSSGAGTLSFDATASAAGIRIENSDAGSEINVESTQVTYTAGGDMEFHAGDHLYAEISVFASTVETDILSSNDVWMRSSALAFTVAGGATFGTQGSGNYQVETATHNINAVTDVVFDSHGNLGGLGGRYVADNHIAAAAYGPDQLAAISNNINAIEMHSVSADVELVAVNDIFIESHGGSIEIRSQNDIHYALSTASGNLGFYGILETLPAAGTFQQIGFTREGDYCQTLGATQRCVTFFGGTSCTVDCTFTSGAINDIADMLVAYGLAGCDGVASGFCCVFPNC